MKEMESRLGFQAHSLLSDELNALKDITLRVCFYVLATVLGVLLLTVPETSGGGACPIPIGVPLTTPLLPSNRVTQIFCNFSGTNVRGLWKAPS